MPLTLPNLITVIRLLLVPAVVVALAQEAYGWALAGFLAAGISDAVDGILARALHQHTRIGAVLDAVADKLIIFSTIAILALTGVLPWWLSAVLVGRDLLIVLGIVLYRRRVGEVEIAPLFLGKLHVFVVFALLTVVLIQAARMGEYSGWLSVIYALATATSVASVLVYATVWIKKLRARNSA